VTNEDLSKLAYLAQAVVGQPSRFDAFVELIRGSAESNDSQDKDRREFAEAVNTLVKAWERFGDDPPSTRDIVALAGELERKRSKAAHLVGIALSWAAQNQLWLRQLDQETLDPQEVEALDELSDRAAAPGF
jgi:hypothetical protein